VIEVEHLTIDRLSEETIAALEALAAPHGHSLEAQVLEILRVAVAPTR